MKTKRNILFTTLILIIYIITVLVYAISLFTEYRTGPERTDFRISELVRETRQNAQTNMPGSDSFNSTLIRSMGNVADLAGLQVLKDGKLIFSYPKDLSESNAGRSSFVRVKSEKFKGKDSSELTMTAAVYMVTPDSFAKKGIIAFSVILLTTVAAIIHLVMLYRSDNQSQTQSENDNYQMDDDAKAVKNSAKKQNKSTNFTIGSAFTDERKSDDLKEPDEKEFTADPVEPSSDDEGPIDDVTVYEEPPLDSDETVADEIADEQNQADESADDSYEDDSYELPVIGSNLTQEEYQALTKDLIDEPSIETEPNFEETNDEPPQPQYSLPAENTPARIFTDGLSQRKPEKVTPPTNYLKPLPSLPEKKEEEPLLKPVAGTRPMPEGLFSPETGFGWEEYMMPRLDSELMKSASSDQDISLFMLNIPKFDWTSDAGQEIISIIEKTFQFKDLIFEYGESGCSAIMQNMNIREALKTAENLHTDIISTLAKRSIYRIVNIGISSRSLRLISGKRLANEAEQALLHAMNEKNTPIVAFKVNPEKYRKYISREVAKLEENNA